MPPTSDLTRGEPLPALLRHALPLLLGSLLNLAAALGDRLWVGRLGSEALAGLGVSHALWMLAMTAILGLGLGTLAAVAAAWGAGRARLAARAAAQGLIAALALGAALALLAWPVASQVLPRLLPRGALEVGARGYLCWTLVSALTQAPATVAIFSLQAAGASRAALLAGAVFPLANLALDPLGIALFGLPGAALATCCASALGLLAALVFLRRTLPLRARDLRPEPRALRELAATGAPRTLDHLTRNGAGLVLVALLAPYGASVVAGYTAVLALLLVLIFPGVALGQSVASFVGQNLGAGLRERAWRGALLGVLAYALALLCAGGILSHWAPSLLALFDGDPRAQAAGAALLRTLAPALPFLGAGLILGKAFGGARRPGPALLATLLAHLVLQIPLVVVLGAAWGPRGAFLAMALAYGLHGLLSLGLFWANFAPKTSSPLALLGGPS